MDSRHALENMSQNAGERIDGNWDLERVYVVVD
jgi:hypothetical protein